MDVNCRWYAYYITLSWFIQCDCMLSNQRTTEAGFLVQSASQVSYPRTIASGYLVQYVSQLSYQRTIETGFLVLPLLKSNFWPLLTLPWDNTKRHDTSWQNRAGDLYPITYRPLTAFHLVISMSRVEGSHDSGLLQTVCTSKYEVAIALYWGSIISSFHFNPMVFNPLSSTHLSHCSSTQKHNNVGAYSKHAYSLYSGFFFYFWAKSWGPHPPSSPG